MDDPPVTAGRDHDRYRRPRRAGRAEPQQTRAFGIVLDRRRHADAVEVLGHGAHRRRRRPRGCHAEVGATAVVQHLGDVDNASGALADPQRDVVVEGQGELGSDASRVVERAAPEDGEAACVRVHGETLG